MTVVAHIFFYLGGLICFVNFYTSFLAYPVHLLIYGRNKPYKNISGFPLVGSLFVGLSLIGVHGSTWMLISGIVLMAMDTGGIHWFGIMMIYFRLTEKKQGGAKEEAEDRGNGEADRGN